MGASLWIGENQPRTTTTKKCISFSLVIASLTQNQMAVAQEKEDPLDKPKAAPPSGAVQGVRREVFVLLPMPDDDKAGAWL